jgi:hypothetical protein
VIRKALGFVMYNVSSEPGDNMAGVPPYEKEVE